MTLFDRVCEVLRGIDKTQVEDPDGWWETFGEAEFGAEKLKNLRAILTDELKTENGEQF